jgi:hypothetical protein
LGLKNLLTFYSFNYPILIIRFCTLSAMAIHNSELKHRKPIPKLMWAQLGVKPSDEEVIKNLLAGKPVPSVGPIGVHKAVNQDFLKLTEEQRD